MFYRSILLQLLIILACESAVAQAVTDTSKASLVYKKIEDYTSKRKFTHLIHGLVLKPVETISTKPLNKLKNSPTNLVNNKFEGKIIRNINITTLDPFGFSVEDTNRYPRSFLEKSGNSLHVKSLHITIRNRLLFHRNELYDSLLINESERLIRSQSYIHDVETRAGLTAENSDSVDISIRVSDLWSIMADGGLSSDKFNIKLADKNLAGLGHTFSNSYTQNFRNGENAFSTDYFIPNIKNTYISTRLLYTLDEKRNYLSSMNFERPFFSPVTRWAGGITISQQKQPGWIYKNDTTRLFLDSKFNLQDCWAAMAWQIFKGKSETDRTTKLILSARVFNIKYLEKPLELPDILDYYTNEHMFMTGLGISSRRYIKQSYVFKFGTTEDVPVGLAYGLVAGYQVKNHERWYWGFRYSWGNFFKWGYFSSNIEYGTFINATYKTESVLKLNLNYFSGLFSIGNWKFRQFVKPDLTIGLNRTPFIRLDLNDGNGLNGFNSDELSGTSRFLLVIQTQSYAPWNVLGFRFGPYLNLSFGMLGNEETGFRYSRFYPQLGMGVLIKNDYLTFKYFQLSFAFYPSIPGTGDNVLKANPFRTTDFGFPDFIIGKPDIIEFK